MTSVTYEFESSDTGLEDTKALLHSANAVLFRMRQHWGDTLWKEYQAGLLHREERIFRFEIKVLTADTDVVFCDDVVEFDLGKDLFNICVELYANYGWRGWQALLACLSSHTLQRRRLVYETLKMIDDYIGSELVYLQKKAQVLAKTENEEKLKWVRQEIKKFKFNSSYKKWELGLGKKDELHQYLLECHVLQNKIIALDAKITERNQKDGGDYNTIMSKRARDRYRQLLVDLYQNPKDKLVEQLIAVQEKIVSLYAPSVLILNELGNDLSDRLTLEQRLHSTSSRILIKDREIELKYDDQIYHSLLELEAALSRIATSLDNPGIESRINEYRSWGFEKREKVGGLHKWILDEVLEEVPGVLSYIKNGIRYGLSGLYFTHQQHENYCFKNRVLGRPAILARLQESIEDSQPSSFTRAVLKQYSIDLKRQLIHNKKSDEFYQSIWHFFEVVGALAGLILAILSIPFGAGAVAVPVALTVVISAIGLATLVLGLVLLVGGLLKLLNENLYRDTNLQQKMMELAQINPDALEELAEVLTENHLLLEQATSGLLIEFIKLVAAHKLRPVAFMLDMDGYIDDMETMGASF